MAPPIKVRLNWMVMVKDKYGKTISVLFYFTRLEWRSRPGTEPSVTVCVHV